MPCGDRAPSFAFIEAPSSDYEEILAVVRYTHHCTDGRASSVLQQVYENCPEEMLQMEQEVELALRCGIDVTVASYYELEMFPTILWLTTG